MCFRKSRCEWVLSLPKRLRYFLHHEPALIGPVLRIFLDAVEDRLKVSSPGALAEARFGAVTFVHRFGSALNANLHFHCAVIDGVFGAQGERVQFHEARLLCPADIAAVQRAARTRVLRLFARRGLIPPEAAAEMRQWERGGRLLSPLVRIETTDRKGLERLLRYCARPIFGSERLLWAQPAARRGQGRALHAAPRMQRLIYQLPKPRPDGQTVLSLTPMEFFERWRLSSRHHAGTVTAIMASWPRMPRCVGGGLRYARRRYVRLE
jgi:putative transposase